MKTKHLFILGIAALMLAACELSGSGEDAFSGEPLAQGMGQALIRLDTGALNGRTVTPGLEGLSFTLDLSAAGKTPVTKTLTSGLSLTVALEPGDWNLEVKGYRNSSILTVQGTSSVPITAGLSSTVDVYLAPDFSSLGVGTLSYSVSFPETVSRAFACTPWTFQEPRSLQESAGKLLFQEALRGPLRICPQGPTWP
jgi:hypothetical protein